MRVIVLCKSAPQQTSWRTGYLKWVEFWALPTNPQQKVITSTSVKLIMFVIGSKKVNFDSNYIDCLVNIKVTYIKFTKDLGLNE